MTSRRSLMAAACACTAAALFAGCGSSAKPSAKAAADETVVARTPVRATAPQQTLTFVATEFAFAGPKAAPAGLTNVRLVNRGKVDHQLALFRLEPGVETGTVLGAIGANGLEAGRRYGHWVGGPNGTGPGHTTSVVVDLEPGRYIVACVMPDATGTPHALKGMLGSLGVTAPRTPVAREAAGLPQLTLADFNFTLPAGFNGHGPVVIANRGHVVHEAVIVRLHPGKTVGDVITYESKPFPRTAAAPDTAVGGITLLDPGRSVRLDLDLPPGNYAWLCFLPATDKLPHLAHGMAYPFVVSSR